MDMPKDKLKRFWMALQRVSVAPATMHVMKVTKLFIYRKVRLFLGLRALM
jgi:hypothetical protein